MSDTFRLLVTGHRRTTGTQARYVQGALGSLWLPRSVDYDRLTIVHGACPFGGVDAVAEWWAGQRLDTDHEPHPMVRGQRGAGPRRNQLMVDLGADLCVGFPGLGSRGTWDCLAKAVDAGIPTILMPLPRN